MLPLVRCHCARVEARLKPTADSLRAPSPFCYTDCVLVLGAQQVWPGSRMAVELWRANSRDRARWRQSVSFHSSLCPVLSLFSRITALGITFWEKGRHHIQLHSSDRATSCVTAKLGNPCEVAGPLWKKASCTETAAGTEPRGHGRSLFSWPSSRSGVHVEMELLFLGYTSGRIPSSISTAFGPAKWLAAAPHHGGSICGSLRLLFPPASAFKVFSHSGFRAASQLASACESGPMGEWTHLILWGPDQERMRLPDIAWSQQGLPDILLQVSVTFC